MKKVMLWFMIILFLVVSIFPFLAACMRGSQPAYWKPLLYDKTWVQDLNQWLSLSYAEEKDRAAFITLWGRDITPELYSTYAVVRILDALGMPADNANEIAGYIDSLRNGEGAYNDPLLFNHPLERSLVETMEAVEVLNKIGAAPEHADSTIAYFLNSLNEGHTYLAINGLIKLGEKDKIPQEAREFVLHESEILLGQEGPGPSILEKDGLDLINDLAWLVRMGPALASPRAREFISRALREAPDMPVHTFLTPNTMNTLLEISRSLALPEADQDSVLERLRMYLKEKIFPLQNISGGFGPGETVEPVSTGEIVILAHRLGVAYPNFEKLMIEIDRHRISNGWVRFIVPTINEIAYEWTYYALEIAKFSGYRDYDRDKIERFLAGSFSSNDTQLRDIYFSVMALETMNGKLSKAQQEGAKKRSLELFKPLADGLENGTGGRYLYDAYYATQLGKELSLKLPADVESAFVKVAGYLKNDMANMPPKALEMLWWLQTKGNTISGDTFVDALDKLYDTDTGSYKSYKFPSSANAIALLVPDMVHTYYALKLLSDMGQSIPDENKTLSFVLNSKSKYGFDWAPEAVRSELQSDQFIPESRLDFTYAAMMILKQLSK